MQLFAKIFIDHAHRLGNSKAAAHVAVDLQFWYTVKH